MQHPDVCIAGAGIIGLSLALELTRRGARVTIFDRGPALAEASTAAAGMLAANDPGNPPQLQPLAHLSVDLYPAFLDHIANLSDIRVPFQTELTLQETNLPSIHDAASLSDLEALLPSHNLSGHHLTLLDEHSIDPRQLAPALLRAVQNTSIQLITNTPLLAVESSRHHLTVITRDHRLQPTHLVDCTGAWTTTLPAAVLPSKGQMLSVSLPQSFPLSLVLRTDDLYIVPRTTGPYHGRAIIGATVEDVGFDKLVHPSDIAHLRERAVQLFPALAEAPVLDQWSGLRPRTADQLPLLGAHPSNPKHIFATGHFRNGILLAPATAHLLTQLLLNDTPDIGLEHFAPDRFIPAPVA